MRMIFKPGFFIIILTMMQVGLYAQSDVNAYDAQGLRHGKWRKNFEGTENLRYQGQFVHGREVGTFTYYLNDVNNTIAATREFGEDGSATVTYYASNGRIISKGMMQGKERVGEWNFYHKNSTSIMNVENYHSGKLHGEYKVFYKNGRLLEEANYSNGTREGVSMKYYPNGKKSAQFQYKDDMLHGEVKYFDVQERVTSEGRYKNDKRVGWWNFYENGELKETKNYSPTNNPKYRNN